jgi:hypothetical protein
MYKIITTTDGKYVGKNFELTPPPVAIADGFLFQYEKSFTSGDLLVLSNSNYVIVAKEEVD